MTVRFLLSSHFVTKKDSCCCSFLLLLLCYCSLYRSTCCFASAFSSSSSIRHRQHPIPASPMDDGDKTMMASTAYTSEITNADVKEYYGTTLQTSDDLKTNACTTSGAPPKYIQRLLGNIHPVVLSKYYGCGLCVPSYNLDGCAVLDLGCGAGRDVYLVSQLVGPTGKVVGIDMTEAQLEAARQYQPYHSQQFGYDNVEFIEGYLEKLSHMMDDGILQKGSFDLIISNCVINLCTDKYAVLLSCYELLKEGGEFYFSDVYATRRIPSSLRNDVTLYGECLSGALYYNDFIQLAKQVGFADPRLVEDKPITIHNPQVLRSIQAVDNQVQFYSATYRLQKVSSCEPTREDYGQAIMYHGTVQCDPTDRPDGKLSSYYPFDKYYAFETGKVYPVCGNTYKMLQANPKLAPHFTFLGGSTNRHYGEFMGYGNHNVMPYDPPSSSTLDSTVGGGCCPSPSATAIATAAVTTTTKNGASSSGGCCPPKAETSSGGCCPPKAESTTTTTTTSSTTMKSGGGCCGPSSNKGGCC